jgi:hypothetical protein
MKKWLTFVLCLQVLSLSIFVAQMLRIWPDDLWAAGWLLGFPGSVLGMWASERVLWTLVSDHVIAIVDLTLSTLINLILAFAVGWIGTLIGKRSSKLLSGKLDATAPTSATADSPIYDPRTIEELVSAVDTEMAKRPESDDRRTPSLFALELCLAIEGSLSEPHRQAVDAARAYLEQGEKQEADRWINDLAKRGGSQYPPNTPDAEIAKERLVWCALNRVSPFSGYSVEFDLCVAEDAGVSFDQMLDAARATLGHVVRLKAKEQSDGPSDTVGES